MPRDLWGPLTTVMKGRIPGGEFEFKPRAVAPGRLPPLASYAFDGVKASEATFDLTFVRLTVQNSAFQECRFTQRNAPASDGTWAQGSLGRRPTTYRRCSYEGVRFRIRAGFSVGQARFEQCSFLRCRFDEHFSFCADYADCLFEGTLRKAVFYGCAPDGHYCDGKTNQFEGNDFTRAVFRDVGFRGGIDASRQQWPEGFDPQSVMRA